MWAIGLILYEILTGVYLFDKLRTQSKYEIMQEISNIKQEEIKFDHSSVSSLCKQLLGKLVNPIPHKRYTTDDCLKHPWVNQDSKEIP